MKERPILFSGKAQAGQVIDLQRKRHARLTLAAFDRFTHEAKRDQHEQRAAVERKAREAF